MVLKKSNCSSNTGNTVRKKHTQLQFKGSIGKGTKISNLKYYSHRPDFDYLLQCMEEKIKSPESVNQMCTLMTVKSLLENFIDINDDITEGLYSRDYIPTLGYDVVEHMVRTMKDLLAYESQIHDGSLDLGLGLKDGINITLTVYEYGELSKFGRHVYTFDTNRSYSDICREYEEEQILKWETAVMRDREISHNRGIQRKHKFQERSTALLEPDHDTHYPVSEEISITVIKAEPSESMYNALHWSSVDKPQQSRGKKKAYKKSSHQKVRNWNYHHNISRKEIDDSIAMYLDRNTKYLRKIQRRNTERGKRFQYYKRKHPEMVHLGLAGPKIPPGLWPDDAARIMAKHEKVIKEVQRVYDLSIQKNSKKKAKLKKRRTQEMKQPGETFLTRVSFVDDYEYVDRHTAKKKAEVVDAEKPKEIERVVRTLEPWEFVDEILHHSEPEMQVRFKNCEGNLTPSPPPPSLKPSIKERRSSKASSDGEDFPLLGLAFVGEEDQPPPPQENEVVSEVSSQAHGPENPSEDGRQFSAMTARKCRKTNKTNGRKRKKLKEKRETLCSARAVSFTEEITSRIQSGAAKSVADGEKGHRAKNVKGEGHQEQERKVTLSRQVSIHTKDNTREFVESLSDYRYDGIQLKVKSSTLKPSYLVRKFGPSYQEASTFPRLLSIDVTEKIIDVVKLFRKTEEPFNKPIASLVLKPNHGSGNEMTSLDDNLNCTVVSLYIKADVEMPSFEELYHRMKDKLKYNLIYPVSNIVDDFVQIYKLLPYTSYLQPRIIPAPSPRVDERVRSQLDWLYTLCQWKFDIYTAEEAYTLFQKSFQVMSLARPSTSSLCRTIDSTPNLALRSCDLPACYNSPILQLLSCQHSLCLSCIQENIVKDLSRKRMPIVCWVPGCKTVLDPVCLQYLLSLPLYKLQQVYLEDLRIQTHPLWQWCPKEGCGRIAKLSGAGFLDNGVVIMCDCGTVWCFHCRKEGHWPASCAQANTYFNLRQNDYKDLKESKNLISGACPITRVLCAQCSKPDFRHSNPLLAVENAKSNLSTSLLKKNNFFPNTAEEGNSSGLDSGFGSEDGSVVCECVYEVCRRCVQTMDSALSVPDVLLNGKQGLSPSASQPVVLPLLYYRSALLHHQEKQFWSWAVVEIRTGKILQQLKKSKARITSSSPTRKHGLLADGRTTASKSITPFSHHGVAGSYGDGSPSRASIMTTTNTFISEKTLVHLPKKMSTANRPRTSHVNLSPTLETEKFFLVLVQQFIQQSHVLLEYVYVYLMEPESAKKTPEIIPLVISLEAIVKQIQQLLSSMKFSSSSILTKLHKLHDAGNKIIIVITTTFKNTNVNSLASKSPTTLGKTSYNKLPPIGHKYTKVKFAATHRERNPTFT